MHKVISYAVASLLLLTGCIDQIGLQRNYVGDRDYCREDSEVKVGTYTGPLNNAVSDRERHGMLLTLFSECMRARDWAVAGPKKDKPKDPVPPIIDTARAPEGPIFIPIPEGNGNVAPVASSPTVNYYVFGPSEKAAPVAAAVPASKPRATPIKKRRMSVPRTAEDSNCNENSLNQPFIDTYYATPAPNLSKPIDSVPAPAPASTPKPKSPAKKQEELYNLINMN